MDEMTNALVESAQDLIEELVSLLLNEAAMPVKIAATFVKTAVSFKEAFFWKKFSRLLEGGDLSEEERAKFYGKLDPFVIPTPAAVIPPPARAAIPKPDCRPDRREPRFWDALPMGAVSWSTMFSTTLSL